MLLYSQEVNRRSKCCSRRPASAWFGSDAIASSWSGRFQSAAIVLVPAWERRESTAELLAGRLVTVSPGDL